MLKRFTVSLEDDLLDEFDAYIRSRQYNNRSEAVRDLIRQSLIKEEWEAGKEVVGVISLVYDHHQYQLQERIRYYSHNCALFLCISNRFALQIDLWLIFGESVIILFAVIWQASIIRAKK